MSGIVGIYYKDGRSVDSDDLQRMVSTLAHRGPDGSNIWCNGPVGFGHCMCRTTPESVAERQPIVSQSGNIILAADARIDNREELFVSLDTPSPLSETSDSAMILSSYEKWGQLCPERLLGDFAFAIWDERQSSLFCARDHIGIKPFYYYDSSRVFVFASEAKALFCMVEVPSKINEVRLAHLLVRLPPPDNVMTFYQNIERLPPGHNISFQIDKKRIARYWTLDPSMEIRLKSDREYAEKFRDIFTESVRCRLRRASPIGSMLSGGLDSSSVACVADRLLACNGEERLHTFSAVFPDLPPEDLRYIDEREYIDAVLARGRFECHIIRADSLSPLLDLDRLIQHTDEPFMAGNYNFATESLRLARNLGIRVLLDGLDGDTVVSHGWEYLDHLRRNWRFVSLAREIRSTARVNRLPILRLFWTLSLRPLVPEAVVGMWRASRGRPHPKEHYSEKYLSLLNPSFVMRVGLKDLIATHPSSRASKSPKEAYRKSLVGSTMWPDAMEFVGKTASGFSVESRYPFWDRRLVEYCFAIPLDQKYKDGWSRSIHRRALEGILPEKVRRRLGKGNLFPNMRKNLLKFEAGTLEEVVREDNIYLRQYYSAAALGDALSRYESDPANSTTDCCSLFAAVVLARWLRSLEPKGDR